MLIPSSASVAFENHRNERLQANLRLDDSKIEFEDCKGDEEKIQQQKTPKDLKCCRPSGRQRSKLEKVHQDGVRAQRPASLPLRGQIEESQCVLKYSCILSCSPLLMCTSVPQRPGRWMSIHFISNYSPPFGQTLTDCSSEVMPSCVNKLYHQWMCSLQSEGSINNKQLGEQQGSIIITD